jgi:pyridoxamine 5'-phosphate oxidase
MSSQAPYAGSVADQSDAVAVEQALPEPLPSDPFPLFVAWFNEAHVRKVQPNPNAMTLATCDAPETSDPLQGLGRISARIVLCKDIHADRSCLVFYTNYQGRKSESLAANPRAACVFHWDELDRQVRMEGVVAKSPESESDAYFVSRPWLSRAAAWASDQSRPVASRAAMLQRLETTLARFGLTREGPAAGQPVNIPRPPHWGGFRFFPDSIELWCGSRARLHDRARWTRTLAPRTIDGVPGYAPASMWSGTRLQP